MASEPLRRRLSSSTKKQEARDEVRLRVQACTSRCASAVRRSPQESRKSERSGDQLRGKKGRKRMISATEMKVPKLMTALPGPKAKQIVERDAKFMSPSFTRDYPLVAKSGRGAMVEDIDGNVFLDFAAGIAVCSTGHCRSEERRVGKECRS